MNETLKRNVIEVAKHHRAHCHEPCNCSLNLLEALAVQAGLQFTPEEHSLFL